MRKIMTIGILLIMGLGVLKAELDITFVGTVEGVGDTLSVRVDEILATAAGKVCARVEVKGSFEGIGIGDKVHVKGFYDPESCIVRVEGEDHFLYKIPEGAELEKLDQSLQFRGEIVRIYEMRGETFCDITVKEVLVVTFQQKEMCGVVTVKIDPVVGEVEEGLEPGDVVEFSGSYDEGNCVGSLGWHGDYLRKERGLGVSWVLVLGGLVGYLVLRKV